MSNESHHYASEGELQEICRTLFCGKVVIWPFGRSDIHQRLNNYRQNTKVKEWEHSLNLSEGEKQISAVLAQLYNFLKKAYGIKYGEKARLIDELLYTRVDD